MTDATSEPAANWAQFFRPGHPPRQFIATSIPADPTAVVTSPAAPDAAGGGGASRSAGKAPPRKRSRASRRAPTTLLNTDTANFRAMVQQFTGVPAGPYSADGFALGFGTESAIQPPAAAAMAQRQRQFYEYRPPPPPPPLQQQDVTHMGYGMLGNGVDDGQLMPAGFFLDGMGRGYTFNG